MVEAAEDGGMEVTAAANTLTASGHAVLVTGAATAAHGIVAAA